MRLLSCMILLWGHSCQPVHLKNTSSLISKEAHTVSINLVLKNCVRPRIVLDPDVNCHCQSLDSSRLNHEAMK